MPAAPSQPNPRFDLISGLVAVGAGLLFLGYWAIFYLTTDDGIARSALASVNNTLPAIALAWLVHLILDRYVWPTGMAVRLLVQLPLSILFALTWYVAILVIRELRGDWLTEGFTIKPFVPIAFAWQMFQGVTFYTLAALASLSIVLSRQLREARQIAEPDRSAQAPTLLVKTPDGPEAVAIEAITSISGAGDYSELTLPGRIVLSTTTLAEFESRLPQDHFFRAHRSHIVRLGAIDRSESGGNGRTILHLRDGRSIMTSRAGSRLLREAAL